MPEIKMQGVGDSKNPQEALDAAFRFPEHTIAVLKDFHHWMDDPMILRKIKDLALVYKRSAGRLLAFASPRLPYAGAREGYGLPAEIAHELTTITVPLPTRDELGQVLDDIIAVPSNKMDQLSQEERDAILEAAAGMTTQESENAFALAWLEHGSFGNGAVRSVYQCKTQAVKRGGALECILDSGEDLDSVGGFSLYKQFVTRKAGALTAKAAAFGLRKPKGVLLLGAPGTGKSLCAKATATYLKLPLLRLDVGALYGSYVGDSERNTREMLQTAEAMAPVVLWVDEIDKTMGSATAAGFTSDVTQRVIGTILTWRQETTAPVYMVATANRLDKLDPALMRAGRFDAVFWVDLPTRSEREDIFRIHLRKKKRDTLPWVGNASTSEALADLADLSEGYSGAEIAEAVEEGLLEAFHAGRELLRQDIILALKRIVPLSQTSEQELKTMREWLQGRARPVSEEKLMITEPGKRRRNIER
jgi:MoxR-like ATPase